MFAKRFETIFAYVGVFYLTGATITLLSFGSEDSEGSSLYRSAGIGIGAVSVLLLLTLRHPTDRVIRHYWPILALLLLSIISFFWSSEPGLTVRRAGALTFTVAFVIWLCERFDAGALLDIVARTLAFTCVACAFVAIALPTMGVHQAGQATPGLEELFNDNLFLHAGSWRGLFGHKNDFGRFAALSMIVFLTMVVGRPHSRVFWLAAALWAGASVILSNSSQALVLAIVPALVSLGIIALRERSGIGRGLAIVLLLGGLVIALLLSDLLLNMMLGLLGRDVTLSGRTKIWGLILVGLQGHFPLGGGYGAGMSLVQPALEAEFGDRLGHAHNGYLDLMIDIGLVGLAITFLIVLAILVASIRRHFRRDRSGMAVLGVQYVVFYLLGNIAGSFLFDYNSIHVLILVMLLRHLVMGASRSLVSQRPRTRRVAADKLPDPQD